MKESCFCGRNGELEDREPVLTTKEEWVLRSISSGGCKELYVAEAS